MELEGTMTGPETSACMYLAGVSSWHPAPEVPTIGGPGPQSREMTKAMIFHLDVSGHLRQRKIGIVARIRCGLRKAWHAFDMACTPEPPPPPPMRRTFPRLFESPELPDADP